MKNKLKKGKIPVFVGVLMGCIGYSIIRRKLDEIDSKKHTLKFFKIEVTQSFWGKKVKHIQRDVPLTDEEVEQLLNK